MQSRAEHVSTEVAPARNEVLRIAAGSLALIIAVGGAALAICLVMLGARLLAVPAPVARILTAAFYAAASTGTAVAAVLLARRPQAIAALAQSLIFAGLAFALVPEGLAHALLLALFVFAPLVRERTAAESPWRAVLPDPVVLFVAASGFVGSPGQLAAVSIAAIVLALRPGLPAPLRVPWLALIALVLALHGALVLSRAVTLEGIGAWLELYLAAAALLHGFNAALRARG
jgi:hypothetical protein